MNGFANGLFSLLLGWLRGLLAQFWLLLSGEGGSFLLWVGQNWIPLLILLCVIGAAADLVVYLIRWRPWRVWRSFLHRLRPDRRDEEDAVRHQLIYADGTSRTVEQEYVPVFSREPEDNATLPSEDELSRLSFQQLPPSVAGSPAPPPAANEDAPEEYRGLRGALRDFLGQDDSPEDFRYQAEKPPVTFSYREPYIPPQWKKPGTGAGSQEDTE